MRFISFTALGFNSTIYSCFIFFVTERFHPLLESMNSLCAGEKEIMGQRDQWILARQSDTEAMRHG